MRGLAYFTAHGFFKEEWEKGEKTHVEPSQPLEEHHDWRDAYLPVTAPERAAGERKIHKRHYQKDKYLYLTEGMFTSLVGAAINAQLNRGYRSEDVRPVV